MAANNYQWTNKKGNTRRHTSMYELDAFNMLNAKTNNMVKMLNSQGEVGCSSHASAACCTLCRDNHNDTNCVNYEQVKYVNYFNCSTQNNPYSNAYN